MTIENIVVAGALAVLFVLAGFYDVQSQRKRKQCEQEGHLWYAVSDDWEGGYQRGYLKCRRCGRLG